MKGSLRSHHLGVKGVGAVVAVEVVQDKSSPDTQVAAAQEEEVEDEGTLVVGAAAHSRVAVDAQTLNLHLSQQNQYTQQNQIVLNG